MSYRQRGAPPDADLVLIQSCAIPYKAPANSPAFSASKPHLKYRKAEGIAEESDGIDKKVRDDKRPHAAGAVIVVAVDYAHDDIAKAGRYPLVQVI